MLNVGRPKKPIEEKNVRQSITVKPDIYNDTVKWCEINDRSFAYACNVALDYWLKSMESED